MIFFFSFLFFLFFFLVFVFFSDIFFIVLKVTTLTTNNSWHPPCSFEMLLRFEQARLVWTFSANWPTGPIRSSSRDVCLFSNKCSVCFLMSFLTLFYMHSSFTYYIEVFLLACFLKHTKTKLFKHVDIIFRLLISIQSFL